MDPAAAISLGGIVIAGAAFAASVLLTQRQNAIDYGKLVQRVEGLSQDGDGHNALALQFAAFRGEMTANMLSQSEKMDRLARDLEWLRTRTAP